MGGKTHTFKVFVKRKDTAVVSSSSPVRCTLVYADNLKPAPDTIFKVNGMNDFDEKSNVATFSCRINDVSRNHQGKRFRVKIQDGRGEAFYTAPILVKSKKIKKKNKNKKRKMSHSPSHSPFTHSPFNEPVMKRTCMSTEWQSMGGLPAAVKRNLRVNGGMMVAQLIGIPLAFKYGQKLLGKSIIRPANRLLAPAGVRV